jgi:hypothetical protein
MTEPFPSGGLLFPYFHPRAWATAEGRFYDGGRTAYRDDDTQLSLELDLTAAPFSVWALLMRRAVNAAREGLPPAAAFATRQELFHSLKRLFGVSNPDVVAKNVCRLRKQFREAVQSSMGANRARAWSKSLIEHTMLGYRVSIPPERLEIAVFDADRLVAGSDESPRRNRRDAPGRCGGSGGHRLGSAVAPRNATTAGRQEGFHASLEH